MPGETCYEFGVRKIIRIVFAINLATTAGTSQYTAYHGLATVLYHLAESVAHASVLLSPILPDAAAKLAAQINLPALTTLKLADLHWGLIPNGHLIEKPQPIFPRIVAEE